MRKHPETGHPARPRRWLVRAATTLAVWVVAFGVVTALLALFGAELGSLPLALRALVLSGVLAALMANLVMPVLSVAAARWLASRGSGVVVDRLDFDVSRGEMVGVADADGAGKTITVECIQGLRRPGEGALCVLGYAPITGAAQVRPLIGGQLRDSAPPDRLRVAGAVDLFATARARDGTELLEQSALGERGRWGFSPFSGRERHRLFLVCALPGRPERTS